MNDIEHLTIEFEDQTAHAIRVPRDYPPAQALATLELPDYHGVIVLHGGAGGMSADEVQAVQSFLTESLAPFAEQYRILIIDGGTQAGAMLAMGDARDAVRGTYLLLGVCPEGVVDFPTGTPADQANTSLLDSSHSHFILVDGDDFGDESELLVGLLQATGKPGFALVINGGGIVYKEVQAHAQAGNTIVTVRGSGRVADDLADPNNERRASLPANTRLEIANIRAPQTFRHLLRRLLLPAGHPSQG
jgi:hypothetical protein